jgi:hypothetical protein
MTTTLIVLPHCLLPGVGECADKTLFWIPNRDQLNPIRAPFPPPCWLEPDQDLGAAAPHSTTFPHIFPARTLFYCISMCVSCSLCAFLVPSFRKSFSSTFPCPAFNSSNFYPFISAFFTFLSFHICLLHISIISYLPSSHFYPFISAFFLPFLYFLTCNAFFTFNVPFFCHTHLFANWPCISSVKCSYYAICLSPQVPHSLLFLFFSHIL